MTYTAISLGWGVQSFTLAAMVALGELPPVDVAIHADTTHERSQTYEFARRWTPWLETHGVQVITARAHDMRLGEGSVVDIPAYTISTPLDIEIELDDNDEIISYKATGTRSIVHGQIRRQCTGDWKIAPIRRFLQANRKGAPVELWLGISTDEYKRMKDSDVKYITHRWPLIEQKMSRKDCEAWLTAHNLEIPVKSSCVFCPYHNRAAWQELKQSGNGDWQKAVQVDEAIRKARPPYDLFVHPARIPLADVDLRTPQEKGQMELWANWEEECSGICGV